MEGVCRLWLQSCQGANQEQGVATAQVVPSLSGGHSHSGGIGRAEQVCREQGTGLSRARRGNESVTVRPESPVRRRRGWGWRVGAQRASLFQEFSWPSFSLVAEPKPSSSAGQSCWGESQQQGPVSPCPWDLFFSRALAAGSCLCYVTAAWQPCLWLLLSPQVLSLTQPHWFLFLAALGSALAGLPWWSSWPRCSATQRQDCQQGCNVGPSSRQL